MTRQQLKYLLDDVRCVDLDGEPYFDFRTYEHLDVDLDDPDLDEETVVLELAQFSIADSGDCDHAFTIRELCDAKAKGCTLSVTITQEARDTVYLLEFFRRVPIDLEFTNEN